MGDIFNYNQYELFEDKIKNMEMQLIELYAEKRYLEKELMTSDPAVIVQMVKSMKEQLQELYEEKAKGVFIEKGKIVIRHPGSVVIMKSNK